MKSSQLNNENQPTASASSPRDNPCLERDSTIAALEAAGFGLLRWDDGSIRLVTSFDTADADIDALLAIIDLKRRA